jgi:hypothetical protein
MMNNGDKMSEARGGQSIIIVSGLPRSGTSLMMQMLSDGGLEILSDGNREADPDNPKGYFEYEPVKSLRRDNSWMKAAEGKACKVISALLPYLRPGLNYKIILMKRPMAEVLASQHKMRQRLGTGSSAASDETLGELFSRQLAQTEQWLQKQQNMAVLVVQYRDAVLKPEDTATTVTRFIGIHLDIEAMSKVVDPALYRNIAL